MPCSREAPCNGVLYVAEVFPDFRIESCGNGHHFRLGAPPPILVPVYVEPVRRPRRSKGFAHGRRHAASSEFYIPKRAAHERYTPVGAGVEAPFRERPRRRR